MSLDAATLASFLKGARIDIGHGTDLVLESVTVSRLVAAEPCFVIRWHSTRGFCMEVTTRIEASADALTFGPDTIRALLLASAESVARADIQDDTFRATLRRHRSKETAS